MPSEAVAGLSLLLHKPGQSFQPARMKSLGLPAYGLACLSAGSRVRRVSAGSRVAALSLVVGLR